MTEPARDPRLVEIAFLMDLERKQRLILVGAGEERRNGQSCVYTGVGVQSGAESQVKLYDTDPRRFRDMVHSLLMGNLICGFVNDEDPNEIREGIPVGLSSGRTIPVQLTHAGRINLWNMRDALLRNRLKDPTGILFDGRSAERDLQIALWAASKQEPLAVAFV